MKTLQQLAKEKGLRLVEPSPGHIQITGGTCVVNYYPTSKRRSAYISGQEGKGRRYVTPQEAIEMAFTAIERPVIKDTPVAKRTAEEWAALLPNTKYAWKGQNRDQK